MAADQSLLTKVKHVGKTADSFQNPRDGADLRPTGPASPLSPPLSRPFSPLSLHICVSPRFLASPPLWPYISHSFPLGKTWFPFSPHLHMYSAKHRPHCQNLSNQLRHTTFALNPICRLQGARVSLAQLSQAFAVSPAKGQLSAKERAVASTDTPNGE